MRKIIKVCLFIALIIGVSLNIGLSPINAEVNRSKDNHNNNDSYIKNSIIPKRLYVIAEEDMSKEEKTMIATLQGIVATKSDNQIYIISSGEPDYNIWLKDLKNNYNVKATKVKDPWKLLNKFKGYTKGYVLYSRLKAPSINNACTLSSLKDSIAIEESLEEKVKNCGIIDLIQDCRDTDKYWAYDNLWNAGLNHSTVIELSPSSPLALRDYAIVSKSLIFYEEDENDSELREKIFKSMDTTARCLGWGPDEYNNVSIASKFGVDIIAADWSYNLSVLSSYPTKTQHQKTNSEIPSEDGVHYVTIIMSDGDNQQWYLGNNYSSKKWYGSEKRGDFNLGWSISPSLYYLAPTVFNKYYESASNGKYNDNFVVPPSGNGYMYPSKFPIDKLGSYTERLNEYMKSVDESSVIILDDRSLYKTELWDKYTEKSNIDGVFYLDYKQHHYYGGEVAWSNNKPIISCRDLIWDGLENEERVVKNINDRINQGYTSKENIGSYSFVYVHVWSKTINNVEDAVTRLIDNPKVRIVTPDNFIKLIKENVKQI